jgi:uncharacterized protein (TIGR02453 family)
MADRYFTQASFDFLGQLAANNDRGWFDDHKQQYEDTVRTPALRFITDIADDLMAISPHFRAVPKKVGGSLMRVQRDIRFGKDKRPYKTNIGIHFRHEVGKDVHAPGFYLHIEPGECFVGVGIWRPDSTALNKIRDAIVENEKAWKSASGEQKFAGQFAISGESLKNPPRGYSKDHPLLEDLKRKDFIAISTLSEKSVTSTQLLGQAVERFQVAQPYMRFLCHALELRC